MSPLNKKNDLYKNFTSVEKNLHRCRSSIDIQNIGSLIPGLKPIEILDDYENFKMLFPNIENTQDFANKYSQAEFETICHDLKVQQKKTYCLLVKTHDFFNVFDDFLSVKSNIEDKTWIMRK